jgi:hypothetical protein
VFFRYRDKKVVGVFVRFSCAASPIKARILILPGASLAKQLLDRDHKQLIDPLENFLEMLLKWRQ